MKNGNPVSIVVADDHPMFRQGLIETISRNTRFTVVGEASDGVDAYDLIIEKSPTIAILDIEMPRMTGLEVSERLNRENLPVQIIILTMYDEYTLFNKAIDSGVKGYILKESAVRDILSGITRVAEGEYYFSSALTNYVMKRNDPADRHHGFDDIARLTATEKEVLRLIAQSRSSREIAEQLSVSVRTVESHRYNITHKLGLNGSYALIRFALASRNRLG